MIIAAYPTCWGIMFFSIPSALLRFKLFFRVCSRANPASVARSSKVWESRDILKELSLAILLHTFYCDMVFFLFLLAKERLVALNLEKHPIPLTRREVLLFF
jgi:hypothetical protein